MKTQNQIPVLLLICLCTSSALFAQKDLQVTVKNIKETTGTIRVGLFNNENDFLKKAVEGKVVKATANEVTIVFTNLKEGDYAVSVIHDKNENGELDSNFMGIPNEPYGFSNNAMGTFGPPSFEKAKVSVTTVKTSVINLR
jgi:uncharacterized protein (DUF2141 family)